MDNIVVGVDRSDTAKAAAKVAARLAASQGAKLHVVMCADRGKGVDIRVGTDSFQSDWLSDASQFLTNLAPQLPHDSIVTTVAEGDPAKAICEAADAVDADLIVIGNKRVQGLARVLGSVAGDVIKHAHCDVYVANTKIAAAD